jgi:outer membrane protein assembly factor BamB
VEKIESSPSKAPLAGPKIEPAKGTSQAGDRATAPKPSSATRSAPASRNADINEIVPILPSDFLAPDAEPTQRELDSLETVSPPRGRKALIASLVMTLGVVAIAGGLVIGFWTIFVGAEKRQRASAEEQFANERYNTAAADFKKLITDFPKSEQDAYYKFMLELSNLGDAANGSSRETLEDFRKFLHNHKDDPLLKDKRKAIASMLRKLAESLGDTDELASIAVARAALELSKEYDPNNAALKEIAAKLDQQEAKIVLDQKRAGYMEKLTKFVEARAPIEVLKKIRGQIRGEKLEEDPELVAKLKEVEKVLRSRIQFVEVKDVPAAAAPEPVEPSLLVIPYRAAPQQPKSGLSRVVIALDRGVLYALDEATGKFRWATRVGIDTTALPVRLPATAQSPEMFLVLSADRNTLMALAAADGSVAWRRSLSKPALGRPVLVDQRVYVPTYDGRVNEIEINNGVLLGYFDLGGEHLSLGAVRQEGTDCLYIPADSDNVYVLDLALTQDPAKPRKKSCIGILTTGHPSGSLRSEPLVLNRVDRPPAPGAQAPGFLVLCQTAGFHQMKLRVFGLPIESTDAAPLQEPFIKGWSWFEPCHDAEKFAFVTDEGIVGLYGINQPGNEDPPIFPYNQAEIHLGPGAQHLVRGQVIHALDDDFWIVAGGTLQRYYYNRFDMHQRLVSSPDWPEAGVPTGAPLHAGQMDQANHILVTVTRDLSRQITLATAVDSRNGKLLWQRQLGFDGLGDPVLLGKDALIVDRNGAILLLEEGRVRSKVGSEWQICDELLADPIQGLVPGSIQMIADGPNTVHQLAVTSPGPKQGSQLVVRTIRAVPGNKPTVVPGWIQMPANPQMAGALVPQITAALVHGALVIPMSDETLHLFKLPLTVHPGRAGPNWRSRSADEDAPGHVVGLRGEEFLSTDGSRGLTRWTWSFEMNNYQRVIPTKEMSARIVTAPLVLHPADDKAALKIYVADALGNLSLLDGDSLKTEKSWPLQGKITSGPFARGSRVFVIVDRKRLVCVDPAKDAPLWQYETSDSEITGQPDLVGDMLIVATPRGRFVGLDPQSGAPRGPGYTLNVSAAPAGTPVAVGPETALVPLTDNTLFFLSLQLLQDRQAALRR